MGLGHLCPGLCFDHIHLTVNWFSKKCNWSWKWENLVSASFPQSLHIIPCFTCSRKYKYKNASNADNTVLEVYFLSFFPWTWRHFHCHQSLTCAKAPSALMSFYTSNQTGYINVTFPHGMMVWKLRTGSGSHRELSLHHHGWTFLEGEGSLSPPQGAGSPQRFPSPPSQYPNSGFGP